MVGNEQSLLMFQNQKGYRVFVAQKKTSDDVILIHHEKMALLKLKKTFWRIYPFLLTREYGGHVLAVNPVKLGILRPEPENLQSES